MDKHESPERDYNLERLVFFSDGVFAIVITLLALELKPPEGWDGTLASLWRLNGGAFTAYAMTFLAIGLFWNAHRDMFEKVARFHPGLTVFNLLLLGLVTLLPFASQLLVESSPHGEPFAIYFGVIAAISLTQALLWGYAAVVVKVIPVSLGLLGKAATFVSMVATPLILFAGAVLVDAGADPSRWIWFGPVLALVALFRRRMLARAHKVTAT